MLREMYLSEKTLSKVILLWFATIPFGSNILSLSIGYFTLYPGLIITLLLLPTAFFTFKSWSLIEKIFVGIIGLLIIRSIIWIAVNGIEREAAFDVRSLSLYCVYAAILFSFKALSPEKGRGIIATGLKVFLSILLVSGLVEFSTGIHLSGSYTDKLLGEGVHSIFYAPIFVFDNSNDYVVYAFLLFVLWYHTDASLSQSFWKKLTFLGIILVFSIYGSSRGLILLSSVWIGLEIILKVYAHRNRIFSIGKIWLSVVIIICWGLFVLKNEFVPGPSQNPNAWRFKLNTIEFLLENEGRYEIKAAKDVVPEDQYPFVLRAYDDFHHSKTIPSDKLRVNLLLNGWNFYKSSPIIGIGPGQYRSLTAQGQIRHGIGSLHGPHNYVMELVSQFGILGVIYFLFIAIVTVRFILRGKAGKEEKLMITVGVMAYMIASFIPSGFLYLGINWLFLPIMLAFTSLTGTKKTNL